MPRQNRVTPKGDIIATPARGMLMGNRGILHDGHGQIVVPYEIRRWIYCRLEFKGRRREVMQPGSYTELFFLDEATALAAGHRPCAECMRDRFKAFREAWLRGNGGVPGADPPKASELDALLHRDRLAKRAQRIHSDTLANLPVGTFVRFAPGGSPHLVSHDGLAPWAPDGYGAPESADLRIQVEVLTPSGVVAAMRAGFHPALHESLRR